MYNVQWLRDRQPRQGLKPGRTAFSRDRHVPEGQQLGDPAGGNVQCTMNNVQWLRDLQLRQGPKLGRKRMRRRFPGAPSGARHGSADRADHTDFREEGLRGTAGAAGDMFGGGS